MNIAVEQYTPSPLRCYNCQKYGHHKTACKHEKVCAKCGLADHDTDPCSRAPYCINCKGDHPAYYTTCPAWISAKEKAARPPTTAPHTESRVRPSSMSHSSSSSSASATTSKFLVIEANDEEKSLNKVNPFDVEKAFYACVGKVANVTKLRSGVLLTEVQNEQQASDLLKLDTFATCPVKVTTHRSMNSSKGVIRSYELAQVSREDLLEGLASQGVTDVRHIMQTRNSTKQPSPVIILTFSSRTLPDHITACFKNIAVEQYTPSPLRCFSCQKLGHHKNACRGGKVCAKCGLAEHGEEPCERPPQCVNCKGDHPSFAKSCPAWVTEQQICKVKAALNVSHAEARKRVQTNQTQTSGMLYAAALTRRPETRSIGTQTDDANAASHSGYNSKVRNSETQTEMERQKSPEKPQPKERQQQPTNVSAKGGRPKKPPDCQRGQTQRKTKQ